MEAVENTIGPEGAHVCPGLINYHINVTAVPDLKTIGELFDMPGELVHLRTTYVLQGMLSRGFITVRDTGDALKALANALEESLIEGPRLFQCGKGLLQTGGHADFSMKVSKSRG